MHNPFKNKEYLNHLKVLALFAIILFSLIIIYVLLWNPYDLYFDQAEFSSTPHNRRESYGEISSLLNIIAVLTFTIYSVVIFWKKKKLFIWTPIVLTATVAILFLLKKQNIYPDSKYEYTKEGYRYLELQWYNDENQKFKRFRSEKPFDDYTAHKNIVWKLDSIDD